MEVALQLALGVGDVRARPGLDEEGRRVLLVRAQDALLIHHPPVELGALNHALNAPAASPAPEAGKPVSERNRNRIDRWMEHRHAHHTASARTAREARGWGLGSAKKGMYDEHVLEAGMRG